MDILNRNLAYFQEAYSHLFDLVERYPPHLVDKPGACGEWSPRQTLAHLSGWIVEAHRRFDEVLSGIVIPSMRYDVDAFNAQEVDARADLDWDAVVLELRSVARELQLQVEAIATDHRPANEFFAGWLKALARDAEEHTVQLREFAGLDEQTPG